MTRLRSVKGKVGVGGAEGGADWEEREDEETEDEEKRRKLGRRECCRWKFEAPVKVSNLLECLRWGGTTLTYPFGTPIKDTFEPGRFDD